MNAIQFRINSDQSGCNKFIIFRGHFQYCNHRTVYVSAHLRRKWGTRILLLIVFSVLTITF